MQMDEMLKNLNPQNLQQALKTMQTVLSPEQMKQVEETLRQGNREEWKKNFSRFGTAELEAELKRNPNLAAQLRQNPEVREKLNRILQGK